MDGIEVSNACSALQCRQTFILSLVHRISTDKDKSLEFVAETRILAEMKIENRGTKYFPWEKKIDKHTLFSMKI